MRAGMGKLTHRRRPNYATLSPNPPVEAQVSPRGNEGAPGDRFPNCRQEHPKARSEPIHDNTRMSVLSTVEKKKAELPRWREEPTTTPRRAGGEVSEPSAQWAVEEAPLATRTSSRAGALAARAPAVPLLLQVNETFRCAGARRDWERVGAGSWDGHGHGRRRPREGERADAHARQRRSGSAHQRKGDGWRLAQVPPAPRCARQSLQRAPTHAAASARATSAQLPFRPRPRPGFPLGLLAPLLCNTREPIPSPVRE